MLDNVIIISLYIFEYLQIRSKTCKSYIVLSKGILNVVSKRGLKII